MSKNKRPSGRSENGGGAAKRGGWGHHPAREPAAGDAGAKKEKAEDEGDDADPDPSPRQTYTFIIHAGIRLNLKNRSVCTGILLMHEMFKKPELVSAVCKYTLATACLVVGLKYEEERGFRLRTICHVAQSIVSSALLTETSEEVGELATGVGRLEFLVLREAAFRLHFPHPHTYLAMMVQSLRGWMPEEFKKYPIAETAASILRDAYVAPDLILGHQPKTVAITVLSLALKAHDVSVPLARSEWHEAFSTSLSTRKLRSMQKEILLRAYETQID